MGIFGKKKKENAKTEKPLAIKQIDKTFADIKRKALKAAPAFAMALPGGATIAAFLIAYNENLRAQAALTTLQQTAVQETAFYEFGNKLLDYCRAYAIGDVREIGRTKNNLDQLLYNVDSNGQTLAQRYLGDDGAQTLTDMIANVDKTALDQTAQMVGYKDGLSLAKDMAYKPEVKEAAFQVYMDNLYDAANVAQYDLLTSDFQKDLIINGLQAKQEILEASNNTNIATGAGIALTMATMAVGGVLLKVQQNKVKKLEAELANMEEKQNLLKNKPTNEPELER